ncbi:hypothetical protein D3C71_1983330 [compost metagenome]
MSLIGIDIRIHLLKGNVHDLPPLLPIFAIDILNTWYGNQIQYREPYLNTAWCPHTDKHQPRQCFKICVIER